MASNGSPFLIMEKIRDVEDGIKERLHVLEDRIRSLELSHRTLKFIVVYNAATNTLIAFLLWQMLQLLALAHSGGANAAVAQNVAVVK